MHLKTRQEYFYDEELFDMLKTGIGGLGFPHLLVLLLLNFSKGNGPKWGTWPTNALFCPIFTAMIFFVRNQTIHRRLQKA